MSDHFLYGAPIAYMFFQLECCPSISLIWCFNCLNLVDTQYIQVEEKLESGQGKTSFRRFFSRFCTPIFLEVWLLRCTYFNDLVSFLFVNYRFSRDFYL